MNAPVTISPAPTMDELIAQLGEDHAAYVKRLENRMGELDDLGARIDALCEGWADHSGRCLRPALSPSAEPLRVSSASPLRSLSQGEIQ